ncbi:MAG: prepilin peptidase [Candidatus Pacebacteria bacterium]|nr:prepilin peptidase [Candidatus Paceibacterota bacterium]
MDSSLGAVFFALGAIIASFMGVVAARLHTGASILVGRSRCDACNAPLAPLMMVPIVSYLISGGRAHCCGAHLSPLAPVTEALLGVLFVLSYLKLGLSIALPFALIALALLLALVLYDLAHQILPPWLLGAFVAASALAGYLSAPSLFEFFSALSPAFLIAGSLAFIHVISQGRAMGFSDAPLAFGLALFAGFAAFPGFIFSFWIGAVIGIILLARRPRGSRMNTEVPFAPFLAAGFILAYFTQWNPFAFLTDLL